MSFGAKSISRYFGNRFRDRRENDLRLENHYFKIFTEVAIGLMER